MKLSIVTPTCRENPRLVEASRTLAASLQLAPPGISLEWLIVDEKKRTWEQLVDTAAINISRMDHAFVVDVIEPLPSKHRTATADKAPAHNSARSAGLMKATGDYVCFLNDCNVVTYGMIAVIADCAKQGLGYRAKMHELHDMAIPDDGRISYKDHHDLLRPIPTKTACGALWGAPMDAFRQIRGFDLSYDGERYGNDLDAIIRLSRVGITFVTTERAFAIQLRRTKTSQEITTRKDVLKGARNRLLINQLEREKSRIHPLWVAGESEPKPVEVAPEPEPVSDEPKPRWKKRAPPIVGGRRPQAAAKPPIQRRPPPVVGAQRLPRQNQARPRSVPAAPAHPVGDTASGPAPLPPPPDATVNTAPRGAPFDEPPVNPVPPAPPGNAPDDFDLGQLDDAGDELDGLDDASDLS